VESPTTQNTFVMTQQVFDDRFANNFTSEYGDKEQLYSAYCKFAQEHPEHRDVATSIDAFVIEINEALRKQKQILLDVFMQQEAIVQHGSEYMEEVVKSLEMEINSKQNKT
jgi:hypothetical protein